MQLTPERSRLINKWLNEANIQQSSVRESFTTLLASLTDSELRRPFIFRDRNNSHSYEQIAIKYGITKDAVRWALKECEKIGGTIPHDKEIEDINE